MKRIFGVFIFIWVLGGCATQTPHWAGQMWSEQNKTYFTGISRYCPTVSCAYREAYEQSLVSMAQYIGSQISVHTRTRLDNDSAEVEIETETVSKDLEIEKIQVEKFNTYKQKHRWIGYILVSIANIDLERAKQFWQQKEQEKVRRKQIIIQIKGERYLSLKISEFLQKDGFQIGKSDRKLLVKQSENNCRQSQLYALSIGTISVKAIFEGKQKVFQSKGYAETCSEAYAQAKQESAEEITRWMEDIL